MKKVILVFLVLSLLAVSGIAGCPQEQKEKVPDAAGLAVSFAKDAPPANAVTNQEFPIYIEVLNKGGDFVNAGDAKFYLGGDSHNFEGVKTSVANERSLGKQSLSPDRLSFADKAKFTTQLPSPFTFTLLVTSCYSYGTTVQAELCVSAKNESAVCSPQGNKITASSNSIAPVQVTSLTEKIEGSKLQVLFNIENKLDGQVYLKTTDCDKALAKDLSESFKEDKVNIEVRVPAVEGFQCKLLSEAAPYSPTDGLSGVTDLGTVACEKTLKGNENYKLPFIVVLRYKYVDSIHQTLDIAP